jgi:protein-L-isoaspartate(D-aspartate) O-methyltransferase
MNDDRESRTGAEAWASRRRGLLERIEDEVRATADDLGREVLDPRVAHAMLVVPRHEFVAPGDEPRAYLNAPLPIGHGQPISQPVIVAVMTELLAPRPSDVVLEIGTGSGYQAAVLSGLVARVYSIEIVAPLAARAKATLSRLGYDNVEVRAGDGHRGWPEHAPFDGILVTAAGEEIPPALFEQLREGGRLVAPVETEAGGQSLRVYRKSESGQVTMRDVLPVMFVPLTGHDDEGA